MKNIKIVIEYDGTNYHGWQIQNNAITIQEIITRAIKQLTNEDVKILGSSRTDVGVHAFGQVANFRTNSNILPDRFSYALNTKLPKDIVVKNSCEVSEDFNARYSAKEKRYKYLIYNDKLPTAIYRNKCWYIKQELDFEAMKQAMNYFVGTHDFSAFKSSGCGAKETIKTIFETTLIRKDKFIEFEIVGSGFLYNMVRIIVGTLVEVGSRKIKPDEIINIIKSCNRNIAGKTAPANGLYLVSIKYD